jgi:PAS domain S-box-containing protein
MRKKSGEVTIVLLSSEKITLDGTDYTLTSGLDITERKRAEQALKFSEEKFSKAFNTTPVLSTIENDQNVFIDVNQAFLEAFDVTREEAIGSNALDLHMLYNPDDLIELRKALEEQGTLKDFEIRTRKKSGEIGVLILSSDKFMMDGVEHTLTSGLDITERQKAEEKYRSIYNNSVEGIFQSSEDGRFLSVNPAMARIYGYNSPEDMLHNVNDIGAQLYVNPEQRKEVRERLSSGERLVGYETLEYRKDGSTFWTSMSAQAIRDDNGKILYYEGLVEDITPRKLAEAEREKLIEELQIKNEELERFTYTVSHDLKAPLITIGGFLGYLEQDALSGNVEQLKKDIQRIQDAAQKMQRLLNELLELSRIGRMVNKSEEIPFNTLVDDAMDIVHGQLEERGVVVHTHPNLPTVYGDKPRLTEILQNLLENATKYMGNQPDPKIEIGHRSKEDGVPVFFVKDNGIGIAPEYHEKVFGLFDKLDPNSEGTGVGLALVKRIVEVHGGRIWVESKEGQGATFCFTLPRRSGTKKENR